MVREVREGTMILVDWGICRIQKVLLAQSQARARWFGNPTYHHQASLSLQHPFRERNYQCPQGALIISLPHVFPPTYVGRVGIALGILYSWYFDQSKDNTLYKIDPNFVTKMEQKEKVAKCHRYGRYICLEMLEGWGKKCRRPRSFVKFSL